jgi:hypothetical protein
MTRAEYQAALEGSDLEALKAANSYAMARCWDMRFKWATRELAREFQAPIAMRLRDEIQRQRPAGGVI